MTTITIKRDDPSKDFPKGFYQSATIEVADVTDLTIIERGLQVLLAKYREYALNVPRPYWEDQISRIEAMLAQLDE